MNPLRIALIAPPWFAVPPAGYGGTEWVVSYLADGLANRGHDVTLFAAAGSQTTARLVTTFERPPSEHLGDPFVEAAHLASAYARWQEFDVIHDHTVLGLIAGGAVPAHVAHTMHGPLIPKISDIYERLAGSIDLVAISENQRSTLPPGCPATVIHNGIAPARYRFSPTPGDYLLFVGRMHPEKGVLDAIEIARRTRKPLLVLAKINEPPEREYFDTFVRPALQSIESELMEQTDFDTKVAAYGGALATLFPIHWPEPFGLVMIESMATGTPVIGYPKGSVPEVIADGVSGFIRASIDEAAEAVGLASSLDRATVRAHVEEHFSAERNVLLHEALYEEIVTDSTPLRRTVAPGLAPATRSLEKAGA